MKNSVQHLQTLQEFLQHTLVARKPARRGCRGRRGTRGLLQRKIWVQQLDRRHSAWSDVSLISGVREARGSFSCHAAIVPSKVGNAVPAEEQRPSCVVHMDSADSRFFAAGALEHGQILAVDGDVLLQAR